MTRAAMTQNAHVAVQHSSRCVFLYVDVNVKPKGQPKIYATEQNQNAGWLEGVGVGPWAA